MAYLKDLIEFVDKKIVEHGDLTINAMFDNPKSYRGNYCDLALSCDLYSTQKLSELSELLKNCVGIIVHGYKGGEFRIEKYCDVYLSPDYGLMTGEMLTCMLLEILIREAGGVTNG